MAELKGTVLEIEKVEEAVAEIKKAKPEIKKVTAIIKKSAAEIRKSVEARIAGVEAEIAGVEVEIAGVEVEIAGVVVEIARVELETEEGDHVVDQVIELGQETSTGKDHGPEIEDLDLVVTSHRIGKIEWIKAIEMPEKVLKLK